MSRPVSRGQKLFVAIAIVIGLVARLSGIIADEARVFQQFPTEDGYFMLAIARNLAIGEGFSVAGGAMPTNGTQPLTTLIWSIPFAIAGGDRLLGVRLVLVLELLGSGVAAYLVYRLAKKVLAARASATAIGAVAAAIWFLSPIAVQHSMNTLETGYNALMALAVAYVFVEAGGPERTPWSWSRCIPVGVLLGAAFWIRNDGVFLILSACLTYVITGIPFGPRAAMQRFGRAIVFGLTSIVVASPWLLYNYREFGHIMPVSGRAESLTRHAGGNLSDLPPVLVEYLFGLVPIPQRFEEQTPIVLLTAVIAIAVVLYVGPRLWRRGTKMERTLLVFVGIYGVGLSVFYGFAFGAGWFMSRYLFPLGGFFVIPFAAGAIVAARRVPGPVAMVAGAVFVTAMAGVNLRTYRAGKSHAHFQVIDWAQRNVPEPMWIGAVQTGTLNFFHDRTINLDGKVNIDAYEALIGHRKGRYVASGTIEMLMDWAGMVRWLEMPIIDANFRELVHDPELNLGVIERRDQLRLDQRLEPDHRLRALLQERYEAALEGELPATARARMQLGLCQLERITGDHDAALAWADKALAALEPLGGDEVDSLRARAYILRAHSQRVTRDRTAATASYDEAIPLLTRIAEKNTAARLDLLEALYGRAEARRLEGDVAGAETALTEASRLARTPREKAVASLALGDLSRDANDGTAAQQHYEASYRLRKQLPDSSPSKARDLALVETRLGRLLWNTDAERSRALVRRGVERREAAAPEHGRWRASTADVLLLGEAVATTTTATVGAIP